MANKTPFEIRSDLIQLAADHLQKQWDANAKFTQDLAKEIIRTNPMPQELLHNASEVLAWQAKMFKQVSEITSSGPQFPTIEDVMKKATEMYSFVTKKE